MFTEDKVTEIFCMADDFCKFFDAMMSKYTIKEQKKRSLSIRAGFLYLCIQKKQLRTIWVIWRRFQYRLKNYSIEVIF